MGACVSVVGVEGCAAEQAEGADKARLSPHSARELHSSSALVRLNIQWPL